MTFHSRRLSAEPRVAEVFNRLKSARRVVYDAETSGLSWLKNHIVGHVLTFGPAPQDSYYLPVRHAGGGNIGGQPGPQTPEGWDGKLHPIEGDLIRLLDRQDLVVGGHNLAFDIRFKYRIGYRFRPRHEDSMIAAPLIDEWVGSYSLAACAQRAGVEAKKVDEIRDHIRGLFSEATDKNYMGHYWRLSGADPVGVSYATGDGTTTWQLLDVYKAELERQELSRVWDVESRLIPVIGRMSTTGVRIDVDYLEWLRQDVDRKVAMLMSEFPSGFTARSADDVRAWMEKHGHTDWPLTAKRQQPSFPESWLENYPAGRKIIQVRKLENLNNSFVIPLLETHRSGNRVHCNYNQLRNDEFGTITGRLSSDSPNMQQVPKHNADIGKQFRRAFIPDDDKPIWADVDYSQCEPRLLAFYSRSKVLVDGYRADPPIDAHTAAAEACNPNWPTMTKEERKHYRDMYAKRINQTIITGGGKGVLVQKYKVDARDVDRVWNDYFRAMPEVKDIQNRMTHVMKYRGYIMTLLGRRCRLKDRDKAYVALNRALQGGNADILKLKLVECDEYLDSVGRPIDMLINCHDATAFQVPDRKHPAFIECQRIMQSFGPGDAIRLDIPMTIDVGFGCNWAEATYGGWDSSEDEYSKVNDIHGTFRTKR